MKRLLLSLLFSLAAMGAAFAQQPVALYCLNPNATGGLDRYVPCSSTVPLQITGTVSSGPEAAVSSAQSTAAASNLVIKASAGNLYQLTTAIGATSGYVMLFDATALPSDGAVTPVWCGPVTSSGTNGLVALSFSPPKAFATGITAGFSTTGCFTLTASATASFFAGYK